MAYPSEDGVLLVELGNAIIGDEKLTAICVWSTVRHREDAALVVL